MCVCVHVWYHVCLAACSSQHPHHERQNMHKGPKSLIILTYCTSYKFLPKVAIHTHTKRPPASS